MFVGYSDDDDPPVAFELKPLIHQVGGHSSILCLDNTTVCKPMILQELKFYESLPPCLSHFTPEYRGILQIKEGSELIPQSSSFCYDRNAENEIFHSLLNDDSCLTQNSNIRSSKPILVKDVTRWSCRRELRKSSLESPDSLSYKNSPGSSYEDDSSQISAEIHPKRLFSSCNKVLIALENLAHPFEYPCVLDLKMGVRQYGDDASSAKIESKKAKTSSTTSEKLGLRICGMQVYKTTTGRFIYKNKYFGRHLNVTEFQDAVINFFHSGRRMRKDVIFQVLHKLCELKKILLRLDSFRFYTSSLLLIYDGLDANDAEMKRHVETNHADFCYENCGDDLVFPDYERLPLVQVKMIDFAHSSHNGVAVKGTVHEGPDRGYIFGLDNFMQLLLHMSNMKD